MKNLEAPLSSRGRIPSESTSAATGEPQTMAASAAIRVVFRVIPSSKST